LGYLVCTKQTYTKKDKQPMYFGTFIDAKGDWLDTVHFPRSAAQYPFMKRGFYYLEGVVAEEFGVISLTVNVMHKVGVKQSATREIITNGKAWQETEVTEDRSLPLGTR
jgi:error-prone DNA polymerase